MEALRRLGISNPAQHFSVASDGPLEEDGQPVLVLAKRNPFTSAEEAAIRAHLQMYSNLVPLYLPCSPQGYPISELIASNDPYAFDCGYEFNVAPVNDI